MKVHYLVALIVDERIAIEIISLDLNLVTVDKTTKKLNKQL